jgi:hypothetical protein
VISPLGTTCILSNHAKVCDLKSWLHYITFSYAGKNHIPLPVFDLNFEKHASGIAMSTPIPDAPISQRKHVTPMAVPRLGVDQQAIGSSVRIALEKERLEKHCARSRRAPFREKQ